MQLHQTKQPQCTIVIVEDEAIVRMDLARCVEDLGLQSCEAATGEEAVALCSNSDVAVVLMDIRLTGALNRLQAASRIRADSPATQIVFVTAFNDRKTIAEAKRCRPAAFLVKPFDRRLLQVTLELALQSGQLERERRVRESTTARHLALLEATYDAVVMLDSDLNISLFSDGAERIFGWQSEEMVGQPLDRLLPPAKVALHQTLLSAFRTSPDAPPDAPQNVQLQRRMRGLRKDGSLVLLDASVAKRHIDGMDWFVVVARDISEQVVMEETVRRGRRMDSIGHLATGAVHDLNNLLTVVSCSAAVLKSASPENPDLHQIMDACRRSAGLTKKLLKVANPSHAGAPHRTSATNVSLALTGLRDLLSRTLSKKIKTIWEIREDISTSDVSETDLEQIVLNVVLNARDAIGKSGTIRISVAAAAEEVSQSFLSLRVQDDGEGMDAETVARATEPFFSTKGSHGNGVGLSTVASIIKSAGGKLEIDSEVGQGTTVSVFLPLSSNLQQQSVIGPQSAALVSGQGIIWLIETDPLLSSLNARVLETAGYEVRQITNLQEIDNLLNTNKPPTSILLEPLVRGQRGPDLAQQVREKSPKTGILFVSGAFELYPDITLQPAPFHTLRRPYSPAELTQAMAQSIEQTRLPKFR